MHGYERLVIVDLPFDVAVSETIEALRCEGLDVATRFDVAEYLDRTVHHDFRNYLLLEIVAPQAILDVLGDDLSAGAILPTTMAIFELADGETAVAVAEPFAGIGSDSEWREAAPSMGAVADRVCDQLARAVTRLQQAALLHAPVPSLALEQLT